MRIPDQLLKCTGFVSEDREDPDYRASAFIVSVPHDEASGCLHLLTAKHVALRLQNGKAMIALNGKDGLPLWMKNGLEVPWFFHPDETVDVAILPMASRRLSEYDYQDIPMHMFLTTQRQLDYHIGIGDEVLNIGLFTPFVGDLRFTPVIRTGTISMMPDGRIRHPVFGSVEAYLTESRSMGGLSGSPVFVRDTVQVQGQDRDGKPRLFYALGDFHLLGLISGHWETSSNIPDNKGVVNTGISIIVPAAKILEALFSDELASLRGEAFARGFLQIDEQSNAC
jgi:hypothetical protein